MKTPNVDNLIIKISCETTGISIAEAQQVVMISTERKLELIEEIIGHMQLFTTDKPVRSKSLKRVR